jgi:hypothetical protein
MKSGMKINMKENDHNDKMAEELAAKDPAIIDIVLSWQYLKKNLKPFVGISIFAFTATFLASIIVSVITVSVFIKVYGETAVELELYSSTLSFIMLPLVLIIIWGFYGSGYGLAYDIMSSGDEFTRSTSAFIYFSKYWWQYILLSLISNGSAFLIIFPFVDFDQIGIFWEIMFYMGVNLFSTLLNYLFFLTFPSLTAQGSFGKCFKENFQILKEHPKRVGKSILLLYLVFYLPVMIINSAYYIIQDRLQGPMAIILPIIMIISTIFAYAIVNPMWNLVATRMYNSFIKIDKGVSVRRVF